jgi:glycosyltransferase involved in cell wall biosynthesis
VDTQFFTPGGDPPHPYFLVVSALVPYKRVDVAIDAAVRLRVPLKVVGTGPDLARLRARAGAGVEFLGQLDDEALREVYRTAQAVLLPGEEDFGIVPVEAMASGRPVVALGRGGARETVVDGVTGVLVEEDTPQAFAGGMARAASLTIDTAAMRAHTERFSVERFEAALQNLLVERLTVDRQW